jgi:hypothetical protein
MLITVPTAEALYLQTSMPTLTAHLPPIWIAVALTAMTVIIIAMATSMKNGPVKPGQRSKGFEVQARANFNDKTTVEAKGLKALDVRMEETNDYDHATAPHRVSVQVAHLAGVLNRDSDILSRERARGKPCAMTLRLLYEAMKRWCPFAQAQSW